MNTLTDIYNMARELGNMLTECDLYKRLEKARDAFDNDMEARETLFGYNKAHRRVQSIIESGGKDPQELKEANSDFRKASEKLEENEIIEELVTCESKFGNLVNQTLNIVKATALGEEACSGSCESCGGCH